jgi:hypothetical protein
VYYRDVNIPPNANVIVALFVMEGCGACHEFYPRFQRMAAAYKQVGIPVLVFDAATQDQEISGLADRWGVSVTPTIVVARRGPGVIKEEGNVDDGRLKQLFDAAYGCQMTGVL